MSLSRQLFELQGIDLELEGKKQALARIERELADNLVLARAQQELEKEQQQLSQLEKDQRWGEWQLEDLRNRISTLDKKLYSGEVKNPKELLSLQQEIEGLRSQYSAQEDQVLEVLGKVEETQDKVGALAREVKKLEEQWRQVRERLGQERESLRGEIATLEGQREQAVARLDPPALTLYEELRQSRQTAVAKVEQGRCLGCRLSLSLAELQRARGSLTQCSSCGRILYLP